MFTPHVIKTFKAQWFKLLLISVIIILSSFLYILMGTSMHSLYEESTPYLKENNQEDFAIELMPFITPDEYSLYQDQCVIDTGLLQDIYKDDFDCYETIMQARVDALKDHLGSVDLAVRYYKDAAITTANSNHQVRFLRNLDSINQTLITKGAMPEASDEIVLLENYAKANDLSIGDSVNIDEVNYTISGFALFPDYTLPVLSSLFVFDSESQTLALVNDETFDLLPYEINQVIGGVYQEESIKLSTLYDTFDYVSYVVHTESNLRSGAIYTELRGGQLTSVFLSSIIAIIGIFVILILIAKSIDKERYAIGIFKALGVKNHEIIMPYLKFIAVYITINLLIGFTLGIYFADDFMRIFLSFYLLPKPNVIINTLDIIYAIIVPLMIIMSLAYWRLNKLIKKDAITLLTLELKPTKPSKFKIVKKYFNKLGILLRLQLSLLLRQPTKVLAFSIGLFFAFFLMFMSLSMREVIDLTSTSYYNQTDYTHIVSCDDSDECDETEGDQAIMMPALIDEVQVTLLGLDNDASLHPLFNEKNENITAQLSEGLIISKSYQDMHGVDLGDEVSIIIMQETITLEVIAISNVMIGPYVFIERTLLADQVFNDTDYYNQIYTNNPPNDNTIEQTSVNNILSQLKRTNQLFSVTFNLLFISALFIAFIVIYLLTTLSVEDEFYAISLLKVLGYDHQEISKIVLNGYMKIAFIMFIMTIPFSLITFQLLKTLMIDTFNYYIPLQITLTDIVFSLGLSTIIFTISTKASKKKIASRSLQESLKIYQV